MPERLQKIISRAGLTSRRKAEELILEGRVQVNGQVVTELGTKADPQKDHIRVDGKLLRPPTAFVYLLLNKPKGCVTTLSDPERRQTVMEFLRGVKHRVYPVGRLDYHSEGALLLTNDGEFANAILTGGPRVPKTYLVKINGNPDEEALRKFREGILLDGRRTAPARIRRVVPGANPWFEVTLVEGRQNQIRRMFGRLGFLVEKLKRVQIGFLKLGALKPGDFRSLTEQEVERFRRLAVRRPAA
ncbi:MAG: rRNA pseudouridine synthase [Acidobacteria bacterium]|nr:rRNA pseudouridine synthase [Acidobacteriota bacterium]